MFANHKDLVKAFRNALAERQCSVVAVFTSKRKQPHFAHERQIKFWCVTGLWEGDLIMLRNQFRDYTIICTSEQYRGRHTVSLHLYKAGHVFKGKQTEFNDAGLPKNPSFKFDRKPHVKLPSDYAKPPVKTIENELEIACPFPVADQPAGSLSVQLRSKHGETDHLTITANQWQQIEDVLLGCPVRK